ncbi:YopX family protein [Bacillaceae bacterium W0354]
MREIKFRAWDKTNNVMIPSEDLFMEYRHDEPFVVGMMPYLSENEEINLTFNFELMEYTGLKDKNGKEIFEGDIVRCYGGEFYHGIYEYDEDLLVKDIRSLQDFIHAEFLEVIGNIYEHPHLLSRE